MAENNGSTNVPEKTEEEVKKEKDNFFIGGIKKIAKGGGWIVKKVSKYPKVAICVLLDIGIVVGYVGKTVMDIIADNSDESNSIETTFADNDNDSEADSSESDENSTDDD